ncbi:hypothetical protein G8770_13180 [Aestuariicella hydrocarbonica]|uniref:Uncharacterized protein n=1 Tax=Pseudomaricurvus hydrocarbonicus TaxID=1470433 RepID=A0A9E5JXS0_9GAMM|nr:hypothetical protein [Aestuariicella hydrocarbonica]NHO66495.1 hypothetical protein [Aestuariicella hydrocarbonica]
MKNDLNRNMNIMGAGHFAPQNPHSTAAKSAIKKKPYPQRQSSLSDKETNSTLLLNQLHAEIESLSRRINLLQQDNQPNLDLVQHLGRILQSRQSVLHGL